MSVEKLKLEENKFEPKKEIKINKEGKMVTSRFVLELALLLYCLLLIKVAKIRKSRSKY